MSEPVFTVGHSTHPVAAFLALLARHGVTAVADVRSLPYSKRLPDFSRAELQQTLRRHGIRYVFLGQELGARRDERECYAEGQARYELIARLPAFRNGLQRVAAGARQTRLALMCAEKDPLTCHRAILVSRPLQALGLRVEHILEDGSLESHAAAEQRLMLEEGFTPGQMDIFGGADDAWILEAAYQRRADRIGYRETENDHEDSHDRLHAQER